MVFQTTQKPCSAPEGYGFSNDAKAMLGPPSFPAPSFPATSFPYDGQDMEMTISLHY
jgi:uncharacterized protein (DUF2141 family)